MNVIFEPALYAMPMPMAIATTSPSSSGSSSSGETNSYFKKICEFYNSKSVKMIKTTSTCNTTPNIFAAKYQT